VIRRGKASERKKNPKGENGTKGGRDREWPRSPKTKGRGGVTVAQDSEQTSTKYPQGMARDTRMSADQIGENQKKKKNF